MSEQPTGPIEAIRQSFCAQREATQSQQEPGDAEPLSDEQLIDLVAELPPAEAKRTISDLLGGGRITHEQASLMVYLRPELKHARGVE
jgi:hypothetical protein